MSTRFSTPSLSSSPLESLVMPSDTIIWTTQPKSFPKNDDLENVANLNNFSSNDQDTTPQSMRRSVKFSNNFKDQSTFDNTKKTAGKAHIHIPQTSSRQQNFVLRDKNSRFWRARNSIFVHKDVLRRHSDTNSLIDENDKDNDNHIFDNDYYEEELTEGFQNYGFDDYSERGKPVEHDESGSENGNVLYLEEEGGEEEKEESKPLWDSPTSIPPMDDDASATSGWSEFFLKLLKLTSYGITFLFVLGMAIISKLSFHLIASMTRVNKTITNCNRKLEGILEHDKHYHALHGLTSPERIAWLWILLIVMCVPELYIFLRSIKVCLFKQYTMPNSWYTFLIIITSTCEVIGLSLFAYLIVPSIDVISGMISTNSVFIVPAGCLVLKMMQQNQTKIDQGEDGVEIDSEKIQRTNDNQNNNSKITAFNFYLLAFILQLIVLFVSPIVLYFNDQEVPLQFGFNDSRRDKMNILAWALPLSGILISLSYWENFIPDNGTGFIETLSQIKKLPIVSKYAVYAFTSVWKILLYFLMLIASQSLLAWQSEERFIAISDMIDKLFVEFSYAFNIHSIDLIRENSKLNDIHQMNSNPWTPVLVGLIHVISAMCCHRAVLFVCKIRIQPFSFGLPIHLVLPLCVSIMSLFVNFFLTDVCLFSEKYESFEYIFWNVHYNIFTLSGFWNKIIILIWFFSFIGKAITVSHIWIASKERLGSSDQLFVLPFYSSAIIEQSIMLSRRMDEELFSSVINRDTKTDDDDDNYDNETRSIISNISNTNSSRIRVYACATVWHETADELLMMLKSIMRMDQDQASRKLAVKMFDSSKSTVDYYDFQTHLFVDDAFIFGNSFTDNDRLANSYVKTIIHVLNEAASNIHQTTVKLRPPRIFITPYGGRLEWRLPGGTKLIAHLKDKLKIRHRKRWSQVMYMYYLLGFKIFEKYHDQMKREELLKNTFILALDGDINFRPEAVLLLIDLMKKNKNLGAACGRIHPVGSGPMAWYQVFEYAISHWLQKATEHVFGCVLCSPGCFSLFRSSALADINVMHRYTTKPEEAIHYVQYDQGEDRWLCTLMLQQGWRVEYSAAADAFTHCPEGFNDFFIQRRRWGPSTMANIYDLLQNSKQTVKKNDNISSLYIFYQTAMMFGTILSPGTIFLMLVGAMNTAFNLPTKYSFYINFVPVLIFIIICFTCKTEFQLLIAQIFSTFYAMLMLAVLVSTAIEIKEKTIFSPSVFFFVGMISVFVIAAIIHPQEFYCLFPLPVYMMTIPSMYLLLTIYSIINMNIVTWGTRENSQQLSPQQIAKVSENAKNNDKHGLLRDISEFFTFGKSWAMNCACCSANKDDQELYYLRDIKHTIEKVNDEVIYLKGQIDHKTKYEKNDIRRKSLIRFDSSVQPLLANQYQNKSNEEEENEEKDEEKKEKEADRNDERENDDDNNYYSRENQALNALNNTTKIDSSSLIMKSKVKFYEEPNWIVDIKRFYKNSNVFEIKNSEKVFWVRFIEQYLKPLDEDKSHQEKVKADLIDLRNKVVFAFGIINIIFVLFVFLLQINKSTFGFQLRIKGAVNGTEHDNETGDDHPTYEYTNVDLDPIGTVLIIFFGTILLLQFIGMFLHRFETITHLMAFTDISFFKIREEDVNDLKTIQEHAVEIVKAQLNRPPEPGKYEYFDVLEYFLDSYVSKGNRAFNPHKITRKINIQRRSSVAHILKEKQDRAIAQSNMMRRRYSVAIKDEIAREHDSDSSDNESTQPGFNSGYSLRNKDNESLSDNSQSSFRNNFSNNNSNNTAQLLSKPMTTVSNDASLREISTNFTSDIIHNALNFLDQTKQNQQAFSSFYDIHNQKPDVDHLESKFSKKENSNFSKEIELKDLNNFSSSKKSVSESAVIDIISSPEVIIKSQWTSENNFTSNLEENTRL